MDEQMFYCPFCQRDLVGIRDDEFRGYVFVHDDKPHDDEYDFTALQ